MSDNRELWETCINEIRKLLGPLITTKVTSIIVKHLGGLTVHIPSITTLETQAQNAAIKDDYWAHGLSVDTLSDKYSLSHRQIKRVVHQK